MKVSEAITDLQKILEEHGDIPFCFADYDWGGILVSTGIKVVFKGSNNGPLALLHQDNPA